MLTLATTAAFGQAPASIAGKVYRESTFFATVRSSGEKTLVFENDGRFTYLKSGGGFALILNAPYKIFLNAPRADGTYVYTRTGDTTATVDLNLSDGSKEALRLTFTTANGGSDGSFAFWLSDRAAATTAPAVNISMRGQVTAGHPLIVGFVVPGDTTTGTTNIFVPPSGVTPREVLIRVVGPSLAVFGLTGMWADPNFQLYRGNTPAAVAEMHYADWCAETRSVDQPATSSSSTEAAFRKIFNSPLVGAFPLLSGSKDAADVVRLNPGAYTIVCNAAAGDAGGEALVEVYFLP